MYFYYYYLLSLSCGENRSSGRTGQCGLAKEKAETCSFNNSTVVYIP